MAAGAARAGAVAARTPPEARALRLAAPVGPHRPAAGTPIRSRAGLQLPGGGAAWFDSSQQGVLLLSGEQQHTQPAFSAAAFQGRARELEAGSRADSTRKSYGAHWCCFVCFLLAMTEFARLVDRDNNVVLPVPIEAVRAWVGYLSWYVAPGTIDIALAAISAIHEHADVKSPAAAPSIRRCVEGLARIWVAPRREKWLLLPQHVRALLQLALVRCGAECDGTAWSPIRLRRGQIAMLVGFLAFLRKSEVLALDACDVVESQAGEGFDILVRKAKNEQRGVGRSSVIGNARGDGTGVRELLDAWLAAVRGLRRGPCTKGTDRRAHCEACGWFLPRLGGRPSTLVRDTTRRAKAETTNFLTADIRQMLRQLQVDDHPDLRGTPSVSTFSGVCIRRAANSVAAAEGIASALRQVQGRWLGAETHDQHYMYVHRAEFVSMGQTLMLSNMGSGAAPSRQRG